MIKIFKKIRQQLLTENKFSKYLIYAIGEITLVVIGILIAVKINEWNTIQARKTLEITLLEQIKEEILSVKGDVEKDLNLLILGQKSSDKIATYINSNKPYSDSLCFAFYFMYSDEYIYPEKAVYEKIKNEGLDIISNDTVAKLLQDLYGSKYTRISTNSQFQPDIEDYFSNYFKNNFRPNDDMSLKYEIEIANRTIKYPIRYTNYDNKVTERTIGYIPLNYEKLKNDDKFKMLISKANEFRRWKILGYMNTKSIIGQIIPMIDRELKASRNF